MLSNPARAKTISIDFAMLIYTPIFPLLGLPQLSFYPPFPGLRLHPIITSIRSILLLLVHYVHSHLASNLSILFLASLNQLG
jgi:hypothetical protein